MTRAQIAAMIAGIGLPNAFGHFEDEDGDRPQGPPYIYFSYEARADYHADGINYVKIAVLTIELATAAPDFGAQGAIEDALTAAELTFEKPDQEYLDTERIYLTTYSAEVILTEEAPVPPGPEPEPTPQVPDPSDPATLYEGQTVDADGWIVNSNGDARVYALKYADAPQYQGERFEISMKVNDHIEALFVLFIPYVGPFPIADVYGIEVGPDTYVDGMTNARIRFTVPDGATGCEISTAYGGNGIKDITLRRVT